MPPYRSIEEAAYGPFGQSTPRTLGQLQQDTFAKQALEESYAPSFAAIEAEEQRRGDPMQKGIEGALRKLQYERLQPAGARSSIFASRVGQPIDSPVIGEREMGGPSIEEAIRQQEAERLIQTRAQAQSFGDPDATRNQVIAELAEKEAQIDADVKSGAMSPVAAKALMDKARARARDYVEMLKSGFPRGEEDPTGAALAESIRADTALKLRGGQ